MTASHARSIYVLYPEREPADSKVRRLFRTLSLDRTLRAEDGEQGGLWSILFKNLQAVGREATAASLTYAAIEPMFLWPTERPEFDPAALRSLSEALYGPGIDGCIPAAYTYLTQFVAHEICRTEYLDPNHSDNVESSASFGLDLESIYKGAPADPADTRKLQIGQTSSGAPYDVLLVGGRPQIGNTRNDSNLALSQLHCAIVRFHNAIADAYPKEDFAAVKRQVILSFQAILLHDWLPRLTSKALVERMWNGDRFVPKNSIKTCPAEAVLAAFRVGHSMVRGRYDWNADHDDASVDRLFDRLRPEGGRPREPVRQDWVIDWTRFLADENGHFPANKARRVDTAVDQSFRAAPEFLLEIATTERSAAYRTLSFGAEAGMQDGLAIQDQLSLILGPGEFPMTRDKLAEGVGAIADHLVLYPEHKERPPLWWFILREAELFGESGGLAGVGARILAETVFAAIETSKPSVATDGPIWDDLPGGRKTAPTLRELIHIGSARPDRVFPVPENWHDCG